MTCVVGLVEKDYVYIGADSMGSDRYSKTHRADKKVFKNGPFLFGFTSSYRMGQLLRYAFDPPEPPPKVDLYEFMVTDFIDEMRSMMRLKGWLSRENGVETAGTFLVATAGRLFCIEDDMQVAESMLTYEAVGSGEEFAMGSMFSTVGQPPRDRIKTAIKAASTFSTTVGGQIVIQRI